MPARSARCTTGSLLTLGRHSQQRATCPPSAAVRQLSIADITFNWPRLTWRHWANLGRQKRLERADQQQREVLEGQLDGLRIYASNKAAGAVRTIMRVPRTGRRRKADPKYQSKKNQRLKWSRRWMLPVWMREEMKGTKLKKDDFLIK
jgi:hypothetical protein